MRRQESQIILYKCTVECQDMTGGGGGGGMLTITCLLGAKFLKGLLCSGKTEKRTNTQKEGEKS